MIEAEVELLRYWVYKVAIIIQMMIQERVNTQYLESEEVTVEQYRQINKQLRRKIKEKDARIMHLFNCIDQVSKQLVITPKSQLLGNGQSKERGIKLTLSENSKKGKENMVSSNIEASNIFKQKSFSLMGRESEKEMRLPVLERKSKAMYPLEDSILENPQGKGKVVRIPLDRLKPLNSREVKKRFMLKFHRKEE